MERQSILAGAFFAAMAVITGAFGAHALEGAVQLGKLTQHNIDVWHTASTYQFYHALGLIAIGIIAKVFGQSKLLNVAMWLFIIGILFFSGSLYLLSTTGITGIGTGILGPITPLGGLLFICGWVCVLISAMKPSNK